MDQKYNASSFSYKKIDCPVCASNKYKTLGVRGNREYYGADLKATPHIVTSVVKCKNCDFIYTNPLIIGIDHLERDHYNDPTNYQSADQTGISTMFNKRLDFISNYISDNYNLLDIGAGKGEFLNEAKKRNWIVEGIEPSINFCDYAKNTYGLMLHPGYLSAESMLSRDTYSIITLNHVLEHVDKPLEILTLINKRLSKEGILYIEVPNSDSLLLRAADLFYRLKGKNWSTRLSPLHPPFHKYGYTKKSIRYVIEKAGYKTIEIGTFEGKDRGYTISKRGPAIVLRDLFSMINKLLGNRELLYCICKVK